MLESIQRRSFDAYDLNAVQEAVAKAVEKDPEPFIAEYKNNPQAYAGRYINSDLFKEVFPQYSASPEARNRFNAAVHNSAAVLASEMFRRIVGDKSDPGRDTAIFLTGVPGAGKTTSVMKGEGLAPHFQLIYEGQLARAESSFPKFQQALEANLKPVIIAVHADKYNALNNTITRFNRIGRGASIEAMASIQGNLANGLLEIHRRFGDTVKLEIIDYRDRTHAREHSGWNYLDLLRSEGDYHEIKHKLNERLHELKEKEIISEATYRQARGEQHRPDRGMDPKGVEEYRTDEYRSNVSGRDRVQDFLNLKPADALKHHPELKDAYASLDLIERHATRDGHAPQVVQAIVTQAKSDMAENIKNGVIPEIKQQIKTSGDERER